MKELLSDFKLGLYDSNTISLDSSVLTYTLFNKVMTIEEGD